MTFMMIERENTVRVIGADERPSSDAERPPHQTRYPRMEEAVGFGLSVPFQSGIRRVYADAHLRDVAKSSGQ